MKFNERLKKSRKKAKLTQEALAGLCNVTQSTVANWESGRREPDLETINLIATVLNIPVESLIDKKNSKKKETPSAESERWERFRVQYEGLTAEEQHRIDAVLDALLSNPEDDQGL